MPPLAWTIPDSKASAERREFAARVLDKRLKRLADILTGPDDGRLTRTVVNRLWHRLMGRGVVHPVDAMGTEPFSADLLDVLANHLADNRYDLKAAIELIVSSRAYQSQCVAVPGDGEYEAIGPVEAKTGVHGRVRTAVMEFQPAFFIRR